MEPRIQYAKTEDGVNIAYWSLGEGPPLVQMPMIPWSHAQREWEQAPWRSLYQYLAERRRLIRYDGRGSGLSDRDLEAPSLDSYVLDLEAVVREVDLETFALSAWFHSGPVAIAYAARNPKSVTRLILRSTYARASDYFESPQTQAVRGLLDKDWELFTETAARLVVGWSDEERARQIVSFFRESATQEAAIAAYDALVTIDVTDSLPNLSMPTLVVHIDTYKNQDNRLAKGLAAGIAGARLAIVHDPDDLGPVFDEFLAEGEEQATAAPPAPSGLVTILFTDMESSTALTQRLGDAKAQELVRAHNTIVRDALSAHAGSEIKHTGDGIMASFPSASSAIGCAIAIQRGVEAAHTDPDSPLARSAGEGQGVRVRIGLNAGEPIAEEQDLFGTAVQLARRICDQAAPGEILASNVVRELAAGKSFLFSDRGEVVPKGFDEAVRLYEVRWQENV